MARHFLRGDFSVYYWGEAYYGALDPLLLAPLFKIFGSTPAVCLWLPFIFSLLVLWLFYRYLVAVLDIRSAQVAALLLALPAPAFFQITHSVYNYTFILFLGILHLSLFMRFLRGEKRKLFFLASGLVMGFSWYYFRLILVFWAAMALHWLVVRKGPEDWKKIRKKITGFRLSRIWTDLVLLRCRPLPKGLKAGLIVLNLYNLANFLVACFLWIRGNWFWTIGRLKVKLYLWPVLKSSLLLALLVAAVAHYQKTFRLLKTLWASFPARLFALGFLVGYAPALSGSLTGVRPWSPGGLVSLPGIARNLALAVPKMTVWLAGPSRIPGLQWFSLAVVVSGFVFLAYLLWVQTRARFVEGIAVKPFYSLLALGLAAGILGITGNKLGDENTLRFFVPLFFCLPLGLALGLKEMGRISKILAWGILAVFLGNALAANILVWQNHKSPSRLELLAQNLANENIRGGYADYWTAYALTFLTQEKTILAPTNGKERYSPYLRFTQSLNDVVLLGEPVPAGQNEVTIKEVHYEIVRREVWKGLPVAFLRKRASPPD